MLYIKAMAMLGRSLIMLVIRVIVQDATASTDYRAFMSRQFFSHIECIYISMEQQFTAAMRGGVMGY